MKAKNRIRKIMAMIGVAAMLVSAYGLSVPVHAAEYREVTFKDFGMDDTTYRDSAEGFGKATELTNLDGLAFEGIVQFGDENGTLPARSDMLVFGDGTNSCAGLQIFCDVNKLMIVDGTGSYTDNWGILCELEESTDGMKFANTPIKIRLTFDYVNDTDVKLGVYVNDAECFNDVISGLASKLTPGIYLWAGFSSITLESAQEEQATGQEDTGSSDSGIIGQLTRPPVLIAGIVIVLLIVCVVVITIRKRKQ